MNIHNRAATAASLCARRCLNVKRIEIVERFPTIVGSVSIQPRQRAAQNADLFAAVVANNANVQPHCCCFRGQRDLLWLNKFQATRVETKEPKIVDRVVVQRETGYLLSVVEDGFSDDWARGDHVAVGEKDAQVAVDDETGG